MDNFTIQDIVGVLLAFSLFPIVIVFPGYVTGWLFDLFDFRKRNRLTQLALGLCLSFAVSPILLFLTSSLISQSFSLLTLGACALVTAIILLQDRRPFAAHETRPFKPLFGLVSAWTVFTLLSLVEIQWHGQSFFSVVSYDQATRASIIEAITRTGVPPINPSYFPGYPVKLTFLYYFWYILASYVDLIGGPLVDAFAALIASSVWSGIGLAAVISLYLQQRKAKFAQPAWKSAWIGIGLLAVSGLDFIPIFILMARMRTIVGSVDVWNTWIPAWVSSNLWVPHHVAALIAGLVALMLAHAAREKSTARQWIMLTLAGIALASALGLSVYVTLVFALFWIIWIISLWLQNIAQNGMPPTFLAGYHLVLNSFRPIMPLIFAGIVALLLASPFLRGLLQGNGSPGNLPVVFEVRSFLQLESFVNDWSFVPRNLAMLAILPINYILELGFFFVAGLDWLQRKGLKAICANPFWLAEFLLLLIAFLIGSFLRSTQIASNDLGWRAWLPGQFILLVWGVDILESLSTTAISHEAARTKKILRLFLVLGVLTTLTDAVLLRVAWPIMTGQEQTQRYYAARPAYEYLRQQLPSNIVTQNNPINALNPDRPSSLYGAHQMAVAERTAYGVPTDDFFKLSESIGALFEDSAVHDWNYMDPFCRQYFIDVLIINDADPIWSNLPALRLQRAPLFENNRYAIFACGNLAYSP